MELPNSVDSPGDNASWLLLGICGAGMRSLAQHLLTLQIPVVGTDHDLDALQRLSHGAIPGFTPLDWPALQRGLTPTVSTVVHSVAIDPSSPEITTLRRRGLRILSLPAAIAELFSNTPQICIAGTHGKSTTAGMLWWILHHAGLNTARYIGAEYQGGDPPVSPPTIARPFTAAVLEACEYRDSFHSLKPTCSVLTGIEADHFDWFTTPTAATQSFATFLQRIAPGGTLIHSADCLSSRLIASSYNNGPRISWSIASPKADWILTTLPPRPGHYTSAGLLSPTQGGTPVKLQLQVPGTHNLKNAAAAVLAATQSGLSPHHAAQLVAAFPGMRRRFEHRGTWRGADLIDDYAHHPTAVAATLSTVRQIYPGRRVLAIFEPHQLSRTRKLLTDFAAALALADEVLVAPVLPAREFAAPQSLQDLSRQLANQICMAGGKANLVGDLDHVPRKLDDAVIGGDILITLGAGRTNLIHDEIHRKIHRDSAA